VETVSEKSNFAILSSASAWPWSLTRYGTVKSGFFATFDLRLSTCKQRSHDVFPFIL
jgi:hypothetical protein